MTSAMILCAGFGTRLRPLTHFLPKPLLPVGDRPALLHIVEQLSRAGFAPLALNTHHRAEAFDGTVPAGVAVLHEPSIRGTAGGVANARDVLGPGDVLVWNGDIQIEPDLEGLASGHQEMQRSDGIAATLLAAPRPHACGTLGVDDRGRVVRLRGECFGEERHGADYLGVMILSSPTRRLLPAEGCLVGDVLMPLMREGGSVAVAWHEDPWIDIGTPALYLEANLAWLQRRRQAFFLAPNAHVEPCVELERSVVAGGRVEGTGALTECVVLPGGRLHAPSHRCIGLPDGSFVQVPPEPR